MSVLDRPAINIFEILNLRKEHYHNAMLTWLLDSASDQRYGLDAFLVDFFELIGVDNCSFRDLEEIQAEYTIQSPDGSATRRLDIFIETTTHKIYVENKVFASSIDNEELRDQALYARHHTGDKALVHVFIVPHRKNISLSTRAIVDEYGILAIEWSDIAKILETLTSASNANVHVQVILEQYLNYVKEYIAHIFGGFDVEEIQRYVEAADVVGKFKERESPVKRQINGFLTQVADEVQLRLSGVTSNEWNFRVERPKWAAVCWSVQFNSKNYPGLAFMIELYYDSRYNPSTLLIPRVGMSLRNNRISQLAQVVHKKSSEFTGRNTKNYASSKYHDYMEYLDIIQWSDLEQWQSLRDRLVKHAVVWMKELIPVIETRLYFSFR